MAALEHLGYVVASGQADPALSGERPHPAAVELDDRSGRVQQLEDLRLVSLGVLFDLFPRERRPGLRPPGRVSDQAGEVTNKKDDPMSQVLEVLHLPDQHRVP